MCSFLKSNEKNWKHLLAGAKGFQLYTNFAVAQKSHFVPLKIIQYVFLCRGKIFTIEIAAPHVTEQVLNKYIQKIHSCHQYLSMANVKHFKGSV
jgi:hypothetical protein